MNILLQLATSAILLAVSVTGVYWTSVSSPSQYPSDMVWFKSIYKPDNDNGDNTATCRFQPSGETLRAGHIWNRQCEIPMGSSNRKKGYPFEVFSYERLSEQAVFKNRASTNEVKANGVMVAQNEYVCALNSMGPGTYIPADRDRCRAAEYQNSVDTWEMGGAATHGLLITKANLYDLSNVRYNLNDVRERGQFPKSGAEVFHTNSKTSGTDYVTLKPEIEMTTEDFWSNEKYFYAGTTLKLRAGVPGWVNGKWTTTAEYSQTTTYERRIEDRQKFGLDIQVAVPPRTRCSIKCVGLQKRIDVPYTGTMANTFPNGQTVRGDVDGIYEGLPIIQWNSESEKCTSLDSGETFVPEIKVLRKWGPATREN